MSGMLWAALGGGAKAGMQVLDERAKREAEDRQRALTIEDRKSALLFEMEAKAKFARQEKEADAEASTKITERGAQIGNERGAKELEAARGMVPNEGEFANERITPAMIASMPPAARAIYERDMGLTDDTQLQGLSDQITASREIGAPASVRKGLLDSYNAEVKSEKARRDEDFRERREEANREKDRQVFAQRDRQIDNQWAIGQQNLAVAQQRANAYENRGGGEGGTSAPKVRSTKTNAEGEVVAIMSDGTTKPLGIQDQAFSKTVATAVAKMDGDRQYRKLSEAEKVALVKSRLAGATVGAAVEGDAPASSPDTSQLPAPKSAAKPVNSPWVSDGAKAEQVRIIQAELAKDRAKGNAAGVAALERELVRLGVPSSAAPQSAKKDNQSTSSAPVKVQGKAQYDTLPKGTRYVAPDGSIRTKG